ncbi:MAG: DUF4301 family protein [Thermodesulfobacteriota bacterium]
MRSLRFNENDRQLMKKLGISQAQVRAQLARFQRSSGLLRLRRPCTLGDGIQQIQPNQTEELIALQEEAAREGRFTKFIPASGAATRMFQSLLAGTATCAESGGKTNETGCGPDVLEGFCSDLGRFPFHQDLLTILEEKGIDLEQAVSQGKRQEVVDLLLTDKGLNYLNLPKGLHKFHRYPDWSRTALEEHLVEAALTIVDQKDLCRLHITVSPEHEQTVRNFIKNIQKDYKRYFSCQYKISFSSQSRSTNTLAVDLENRPFRTDSGEMLFRPGGHGALLKNLNRLKADLVYIKNIDNVQPDRLKEKTIIWKKILGGYLVGVEQEIHRLLRQLVQEIDREIYIEEGFNFCRNSINRPLPPDFWERSGKEQGAFLLNTLNRPIRVCGMVRNEGEPGGGPFWVEGKDGSLSLQIVEKAQVDLETSGQKECLDASTYFNPVDLVCSLRNFEGRPFDLQRFADPEAVFISRKSFQGRELKALELPGLWNGAMAGWITLFVEVPAKTFSPVKTVYDLLRQEHQPEA